jgi:DNA-binding GntR family transcriptional regulator
MVRTKSVAGTDAGDGATAAPVDLKLRTYKRAVYETLRDMIMAFELQPGERLVETDLATRLGVSKTPVREALFMLEVDGLVDVAPYRGATVRWLSLNEMQEQGYLVDALEMPGYPIVVERITDAELADIARITEDLKRARKERDEPGFGRLAVAIHDRIFAATGYPRLQQLIRVVLGPTGIRYDKAIVYPDPEAWDLLLALSVARSEAIQARDAETAVQVVRQYRALLNERLAARLEDPKVRRWFREDPSA